MLAASALLHVAIARSLFFVKIDVRDPSGNLVTPTELAGSDIYASGIVGCAFSPGAALAALALWTVFIAVLMYFSERHLHPGIPVVGSCSKALSAACHRPRADVHAATLPLQYGVFTEDEDGFLHEKVGFSSEDVLPYNRILSYYEYGPGNPVFRPVTNRDNPSHQALTRNESADRWIVQPDGAGLLGTQRPLTPFEQYVQRWRDTEEAFRGWYEPGGMSRQASSEQVLEEVELLPISPSRRAVSRYGDVSASTARSGMDDHFAIARERPETYGYAQL